MQRPEHHYPANGFDPASPGTKAAFANDRGVIAESEPSSGRVPEADDTPPIPNPTASDPGVTNVQQMSHTAGQPDTWPQRPDIAVPRAKTEGGGPNLLGRIPD